MPLGLKQDLQSKAFTACTTLTSIYILHSNNLKLKFLVSASAADPICKTKV